MPANNRRPGFLLTVSVTNNRSITRRSSRHWRWARVAARRGWAPRPRPRAARLARSRDRFRARAHRAAHRVPASRPAASPRGASGAPPPGVVHEPWPRGASLSPSPCGTCWTARAIRRTARTSPAPRPPPRRPPAARRRGLRRRARGRRLDDPRGEAHCVVRRSSGMTKAASDAARTNFTPRGTDPHRPRGRRQPSTVLVPARRQSQRPGYDVSAVLYLSDGDGADFDGASYGS